MYQQIKIRSIVFCLLAMFVYGCSSPDVSGDSKTVSASVGEAELPSLKGKKVLLTYGGWPGHKPELFAEIANKMLTDEGAEVTLANNWEVYEDEAIMSDVDLIIQSVTMDKITKEQIQGLEKAVKNGVGFAGAHGGFCDAFRNNTTFQYMTGGQFVAHPGGKKDFKINIIDKEDPVSKNLSDFETHTEQYYMHVDPNVKVLATSTFDGKANGWIEGAVMPVAWKKYHDKGRIFYLSIGHDPAEFNEGPAREFLLNGFKWASASKYEPMEAWVSPAYQ